MMAYSIHVLDFAARYQAAGVIASAFYWFLLFAITLIELVCKEIKAMLKQMSCEIHTNFSDCLGCWLCVSVSVSDILVSNFTAVNAERSHSYRFKSFAVHTLSSICVDRTDFSQLVFSVLLLCAPNENRK